MPALRSSGEMSTPSRALTAKSNGQILIDEMLISSNSAASSSGRVVNRTRPRPQEAGAPGALWASRRRRIADDQPRSARRRAPSASRSQAAPSHIDLNSDMLFAGTVKARICWKSVSGTSDRVMAASYSVSRSIRDGGNLTKLELGEAGC